MQQGVIAGINLDKDFLRMLIKKLEYFEESPNIILWHCTDSKRGYKYDINGTYMGITNNGLFYIKKGRLYYTSLKTITDIDVVGVFPQKEEPVIMVSITRYNIIVENYEIKDINVANYFVEYIKNEFTKPKIV